MASWYAGNAVTERIGECVCAAVCTLDVILLISCVTVLPCKHMAIYGLCFHHTRLIQKPFSQCSQVYTKVLCLRSKAPDLLIFVMVDHHVTEEFIEMSHKVEQFLLYYWGQRNVSICLV